MDSIAESSVEVSFSVALRGWIIFRAVTSSFNISASQSKINHVFYVYWMDAACIFDLAKTAGQQIHVARLKTTFMFTIVFSLVDKHKIHRTKHDIV